jgi:hypothetical protein
MHFPSSFSVLGSLSSCSIIVNWFLPIRSSVGTGMHVAVFGDYCQSDGFGGSSVRFGTWESFSVRDSKSSVFKGPSGNSSGFSAIRRILDFWLRHQPQSQGIHSLRAVSPDAEGESESCANPTRGPFLNISQSLRIQ